VKEKKTISGNTDFWSSQYKVEFLKKEGNRVRNISSINGTTGYKMKQLIGSRVGIPSVSTGIKAIEEMEVEDLLCSKFSYDGEQDLWYSIEKNLMIAWRSFLHVSVCTILPRQNQGINAQFKHGDVYLQVCPHWKEISSDLKPTADNVLLIWSQFHQRDDVASFLKEELGFFENSLNLFVPDIAKEFYSQKMEEDCLSYWSRVPVIDIRTQAQMTVTP